MKKNQERRLHRKNAKIVKEGGVPMTLNRPSKQETTVCSCLLPDVVLLNSRVYLFLRDAAVCVAK